MSICNNNNNNNNFVVLETFKWFAHTMFSITTMCAPCNIHFTELVSSWLKFFVKQNYANLKTNWWELLYLHFVLSNSNYESFGSIHQSAWEFYFRNISLCQTQWHYRICVNDATINLKINSTFYASTNSSRDTKWAMSIWTMLL